MRELNSDNFGLLIAYLLPGFVALWGVSFYSETVHSWLAVNPTTAPTVGGFLYVSLGSTAAGLIVSAVRWFVVDRILHWTGIREPKWSFAKLTQQLPAFNILVEYHYRYYQFFSHMLVAVSFSYLAHLIAWQRLPGQGGLGDLIVGVLVVILFLASRDTLGKYYNRTGALLNTRK